jgi:hypothetical protein
VSPLLHAYIDETERDSSPIGRFYLICAVIVDPRDAGHQRSMAQLRQIARRQPTDDPFGRHAIHSRRMRGAFQADLFLAEDIIAADMALRCRIAGRVVPNGCPFEDARQTCLATLLRTLDEAVGVVMLDSRDGVVKQTTLPHPTSKKVQIARFGDASDHATVQALKACEWRTRRVDVVWGNDYAYPHLWLPDVLAYACGQALASGDPSRLVRLTRRIEIDDAEPNPFSTQLKALCQAAATMT